jgi:hypothetical protein
MGSFQGRRENADAYVGPGSLGRQYERSLGQSQFFRDPLHPLFVNSCGIEEHGQLGAREWLIRKNIEMGILKNRHSLPTP